MKYLFKTLAINCFLLSFAINAAPTNTTESTTGPISVSPAFQCHSDADCNNNGRCDIETGKCFCSSGYTEANCSYKEKKQLTAFLLHFFLGMGTGAGHFYAGNNGMGAGELVLWWGSLITSCTGHKKDFSLLSFIGGAGLLGSFAWWLADTIRFGLNQIDDGNGKPLKDW